MSFPIGIDLGTSNSVACVRRRGVLETVPIDGRPTLPSVISLRPDGALLVGGAAKSRSMLEPQSSVASAKRFIGDGRTIWELGGRNLSPVDVAATILARLKDAASAYLGEEVREAVVTVPAYFNQNQKADTKRAAEQAGLRVLQLLPEPTAAAIAYGLDKGRDQTILVYDLGGGTFDVSILKIEGNAFRVLAVDGDFHLGGDDFDAALAEYLLALIQKKAKKNVQGSLAALKKLVDGERPAGLSRDYWMATQRLREAAERAKIELSDSDVARVTLPDILGEVLDEEITLSQYNGLIAPLVERTIGKVGDVLRAAKLKADDVDRMILVGGSTRNRLVRERVARAVKEPFVSDRVDEVVAQGAAIVAAHLSSPDEDRTPIEFHNVTAFTLGLRAAKDRNTDVFQPLLPKNSPIPATAQHQFTTLRANQKSVEVAVFQGESARCKENTFVGGFRLEGIPQAPAGQPKIVVRFGMDSSDLLAVTATCGGVQGERLLDVNLISRDEETSQAAPEADILFLIDTSGSMTRELNGVKASCLDFANRVIEQGMDCRLGLMDFDKGIGPTYKWELFGPSEPKKFPPMISKLKIGRLGGLGCHIGDKHTIPVVEAFVRAFPGERDKIGILISDEVGNDANATAHIINVLKQFGVVLHVVGVPRSCHEKIARETGGRFWDIHKGRGRASFADLLDDIAVEITSLALR